MRVILKTDVPNLGRAGDTKEVKNGYARNFLIPRNLVLMADARSKKQQEFLEKVKESKIQKRKKTARETMDTLKGKEIFIKMKVGDKGKLFGSVTNLHIQKELENQGIHVDKKYILLGEPLKNLGRYKVEVKIYDDIQSTILVHVTDEEGNLQVQSSGETPENAAPAPEGGEENSQTENAS